MSYYGFNRKELLKKVKTKIHNKGCNEKAGSIMKTIKNL